MLRSNRANKQNEEEFGEVNIGYTEESPPNYEDALNHNNVKDDPKKSDDMIESGCRMARTPLISSLAVLHQKCYFCFSFCP